MKTKKAKKRKVAKKEKAKGISSKPVKHEIVVRVDTTPTIPTTAELAEPVREGKKMTIPKTWMSEHQLTFMLQRTPKEHIYKRAGKGGSTFDYVTGSYITKALNYAFGWNWDFEVVEHGKEANHVWVQGRLTVRGTRPGEAIVKTQFGRSDVKQLKSGGNLDYGNDLKAAATDALKKCASMLGFASDIYGKADYKAESGQEPRPAPLPAYTATPRANGAPASAQEAQGGYAEPSIQIEDHVCQYLGKGGCGKDLTKAEAEYSKRLYNRELCKEHYPRK